MIQTILRFTCDECGAVIDCERSRHVFGQAAFMDAFLESDRDALQRLGCYPGKARDRCGRCNGNAVQQTEGVVQ